MIRSSLSVLLLSFAAVNAADTDNAPNSPMAPLSSLRTSNTQSYMAIDPKERALDYKQTFDLLRKEKTAGKVSFQLTDGTAISNIIDMTLTDNSTVILFRYNTSQGIKLQAVKVEDIVGILNS